MKRRSFLGLLGVAPIAPVVAKQLIATEAEAAPAAVVPLPDMGRGMWVTACSLSEGYHRVWEDAPDDLADDEYDDVDDEEGE